MFQIATGTGRLKLRRGLRSTERMERMVFLVQPEREGLTDRSRLLMRLSNTMMTSMHMLGRNKPQQSVQRNGIKELQLGLRSAE
ncbi:hypothetical protein D3C72_1348890 [compost metagenome]